jgi:hypothetical protein
MKNLLFLLIFIPAFALKAQDKSKNIPFPTFKLLAMDSISFVENNELNDTLITLFINFSPECDHCERTIKSILDNMSKFQQTQIVLTSFEPFDKIRKFYLDNSLYAYKNLFVGQEIDYQLTKQIHYAGFPSVVMFDKNKQWIKSIHEETNSKTILKSLKLKYK